ncbi:Replication protein A subunit [Fasciolopsis buskii]|uniref:Replication protein A subunit n=1 Tax=Fasciolopsis buskii TaxID=27845 RepID=A0A8E0VIV8_9TREM|nr:Replication protein A subunit [Fasciolopsis buski]
MASAVGSAAAKKPTNQGSIVPCTCAEVMAATQEGDKFVSPIGMEFSQVTVLGVVRSVNESATRIEYEVDDYTGPYLPVKMFVEDQDNAPAAQQSRPFRELSYVRVHGHVRNFQGQKHIIAFRVLLVTDMNELTTHILEVIFARMLHTKAKMDGSNELGAKSTLGLSGSSFSAGSVANGLSVLQNQILAIVRTFVGERGIPVSQLCEKLRGIPERQIREDLDFLSAEGHVYSTVDDDHFRATEA